MQKSLNKFFGTVLFGLSFSSYGNWSQLAEKMAANNTRHPFPNPYAASVWAGIQNRSYKINPDILLSDIWLGSSVVHQTLRRPQFEGDLKIMAFIQAPKSWDAEEGAGEKAWPQLNQEGVERSPLALICPGSFSNLEDSGSIRLIHDFASRGYHVLVLPNPLSQDYINARPQSDSGLIGPEAEIQKILAEKALQWIGEQNVIRVEWVGESYGALLALASATKARSSSRPLLQESRVTGFGPPLDLNESTTQMDRVIAARLSLLEDLEDEQLDIGWDYYWAESQNDLPKEGLSSAPYADAIFGVMGFQTWLYESTKLFAKLFGFENPRRKILFKDAHEHYRRIKDEGLERERIEQGRLAYWIQEYQAKGGARARFFSAKDDVVNPRSEAWNEIISLVGEHSVILLNQGGHMGYTSLPWFKEFLDANFAMRREVHPYFYTGWLMSQPQPGASEDLQKLRFKLY